MLELSLPGSHDVIPWEVAQFLKEAEQRIENCVDLSTCPGFVPSDYFQVFHALQCIASSAIAPGSNFCEWGCGFGVVTCLAAMLGFQAIGIDIEPLLIGAARQLAADFGVEARFECDSFLPRSCYGLLDKTEPSLYLVAQAGEVHEEPGLGPDDFDVIFAYPGPDDDQVVAQIFGHTGAAGAVLLTYHGREGIRLRRNVRSRPRRVSRR